MTTQPPGLTAINEEMARQVEDTVASLAANATVAGDFAASLRRTGRLVMLGMGASHAVARAVEPIYRSQGIDAFAVPVSEQLTAAAPTQDKTLILTSQSGESAEIVRWLAGNEAGRDVFGLTLDAASSLGQALPCLVGSGGPELAFAATRSITVSLGMHLAVLEALGDNPGPALAALNAAERLDVSPAYGALGHVRAVVTSGRRLQGLAEAIALGIMELARIPAFALEGGQLRHGPPEMFGPDVGLVFFRAAGPEAAVGPTVNLALDAGSPVLILDGSGEPSIPGATTIDLPTAPGMAAVFAALIPVQRFMLDFAARRVADAGTPRRSTKITRSE